SVADRDLLQRTLTGADGVFLMASLWLKECAANPRACLETNVTGAFNVLEACQLAGVSRIVYASSSAVYGSPVPTPITEDHALDGMTFYGASKIAIEQFLRAFQHMYGLSYAVCRYTNVYGPRQRTKGDATSVIIRFLDWIAAHEPPLIYGNGEQYYDFIYVEDAARATILAMEADTQADAFNIASGVSVSINTLVETLLTLTNSDLRPLYKAASDSADWHFSVDKAARLLGFHAETQLADGLLALIRWRAQYT
ncbi:MAG: NAD-dependent epimerase/dehydratase family protein, partial [Anaerolineae bacterium]|nr:NAD-dependent epimerase/dehydratase family protein [Anaerolineae bacterium]